MSLMVSAFKVATALRFPAGHRARLSSFIFHRVLPEPDELLPFEPDAARFYTLLDWIGSQFNVLDPYEALKRLYDGTLPARAAIITFDDGYRDNLEVALPLLRRKGMPAIFFIATGFLDGGMMFNDRVIEALRSTTTDPLDLQSHGLGAVDMSTGAARAVALDRILAVIKHLPGSERESAVAQIESACGVAESQGAMMSRSQLRTLAAAGMRIGGHTRNHPMLSRIPDEEAAREIENGARDLESIIGERPRVFAYPNGRLGRDFLTSHTNMVRAAGFEFAFSTEPGVASSRSDPFNLPRFTPWDAGEMRFRLRTLTVSLNGSGR